MCVNINSKIKRKRKIMELNKKIEEIKFNTQNVYGETMEVSEPIAMASAAGWYVGAICKGEYCVEPFDRYTDYMTKEAAVAEVMLMKEPISEVV
jgi:hypothetical protein|tara:strand:+ start:236 stop:517 length:282 start_codon:yes stop_codon:yes gene_type:complete